MDLGDAATWVATGIAAFSAFVTVWWPLRNRPQASWFVQTFDDGDAALVAHGLCGWTAHDRKEVPNRVIGLLNDGDGAAFNMSIETEGGAAYIVSVEDDGTNCIRRELPNVQIVNAGDSVLVAVYDDSPDTVVIDVHWVLQPTRLQKEVHRRIALKGEIEKQPRDPIPVKDTDPAPSLWRWRLAHSRMAQSARRLARKICRRNRE
mgnify:CR=1 FL=1